MNAIAIDAAWRRANPLPEIAGGGDKESRGRVLIVGGSRLAPGALRLTVEAALRVGAGKVRFATVEPVALPLGLLIPEAGVLALPTDEAGEIAATAADALAEDVGRASVLAIGSAMRATAATPTLLCGLLDRLHPDARVVLDSAALVALGQMEGASPVPRHRTVMTPHPGELAALLGVGQEDVLAEPAVHARRAADRYSAVVVLKSAETLIVAPDGALLRYVSDACGLGTPGSGDVLAGVIAGLLARGVDPVAAAAWGAWLHGEAGQAAGRTVGPLGFLARDLLPELPMTMASQSLR